MLPNIIISFCSVVFINIANGLKDCDDCIIINNCEVALNEAKFSKTEETIKLLRATHCGWEANTPKFCCSIYNHKKYNFFNKLDIVYTGDEIETHPNVKLLSDDCGYIEGSQITGGTRAALYDFPWMALVKYKVEKYCGGALINSRYVLTAAHCIRNNDVVSVRIGEYDLTTEIDCTGYGEFRDCAPSYQDIHVVKSIYHQNYFKFPGYDIALLRLGRPANLTYRNSGIICLPVTKILREMDIYGKRAVVAGWGKTENTTRSNVLLKVDMPIYSPKECAEYYYNRKKRSKKISEEMKSTLCAGELGRDSCIGDSGGPLMLAGLYKDTYRIIQFGIVSYGINKCGSNVPGVYTDVRNHMKWILDTIEP